MGKIGQVPPSLASESKLQRAPRKKEAVLLFLAAFYFLIATNTQSGWLFILSAFLLGLLAICWFPPRRAARGTRLQREIVGQPQRGVPLRVRLTVSNVGARGLREVVVVQPASAWSAETREFRWVIPRLEPGQSISRDLTVTPCKRGEHALAGSELTFGAPFGLFTVTLKLPDSESFLVYPRLLSLSPRRQRTRLAGILTEFTSPRSKGDSRSLRSLREYQSGDDLRMVHWKSSAKTGGQTLLVREHHAPSRQLSLLLLDTRARDDEGFEKSVMLAASLLWSAHRAGTRSTLLLFGDGQWQRLTRWEEQLTALARLSQQPDLIFSDWLSGALDELEASPEARMGAHPCLLTSAEDEAELGEPASISSRLTCLVVTRPEVAQAFADWPVTVVDVEEGHAMDAQVSGV